MNLKLNFITENHKKKKDFTVVVGLNEAGWKSFSNGLSELWPGVKFPSFSTLSFERTDKGVQLLCRKPLLINGVSVRHRLLKLGDRIVLGPLRLIFQSYELIESAIEPEFLTGSPVKSGKKEEAESTLSEDRVEREGADKHRKEKARKEEERLEKVRIQKIQREEARKAKAQEETLRKEKALRLEAEKEKIRLEKEAEKARELKFENERALEKSTERKIAEQKKRQAEKAEKEEARIEKLRLEEDRLNAAREAKELEEKSRQEKVQQERLEQEKLLQVKKQEDKSRQEKVQQERLAREKLRQEKIREQKAEKDAARLERSRREEIRKENFRKEQARKKEARLERYQAEKDKKEEARKAKALYEQERKDAAQREKLEQIRRDRAHKEKLQKEQAEQKKIQEEKSRQEKIQLEKIQKEKTRFEKAKLEKKHEKKILVFPVLSRKLILTAAAILMAVFMVIIGFSLLPESSPVVSGVSDSMDSIERNGDSIGEQNRVADDDPSPVEANPQSAGVSINIENSSDSLMERVYESESLLFVAPGDEVPNLDLDILFIHAHPDDESLDYGCLMALAHAAGLKVGLLTFTDGESGLDLYPDRLVGGDYPDYYMEGEELARVRVGEVRSAAGVLGVNLLIRFGLKNHPYNGKSDELPPEEILEVWGGKDILIDRILEIIKRTTPEVVVAPDVPGRASEHFEHEAVGYISAEILNSSLLDGSKRPEKFITCIDPRQRHLYPEASVINAALRIKNGKPDGKKSSLREVQLSALSMHKTQNDAVNVGTGFLPGFPSEYYQIQFWDSDESWDDWIDSLY
ncbi:MAG: PIG-L family deacetylase [Spirochaetales bacterium]|nr:PIG-L family deacetylase [Spirochaetales bacterium]